MAGENCRSACETRDHDSFGECARAASIRQMWLGGTGPSMSDQKRFARTNENFRAAVRDGLQPASVSDGAIRRAYSQAERG